MARMIILCLSLLTLAVQANSPFAPVLPGKTLSLPQDHQLHENFQSEWWYVTTNLRGDDGIEYGAQFTLFSNMLVIAGQPQRIFFAHAALSTPSQFFHAERYSKANMALAGVSSQPWAAFIDHWRFDGTGNEPLPGNLIVSEQGFAFDLNLSKSIYVFQGNQGFSKKNHDGSMASYYYSAPFIGVSGDITVNGKTIKVSGDAWLDREWSSGMFTGKSMQVNDDGKKHKNLGWDWLSLHLNDEQALMLYRTRIEGQSYLTGVLMNKNGKKIPLSAEQINWQPIAKQNSNTHQYPTQWQLSIPSQQIKLQLSPLNPDQFLHGIFNYWEGAVKTTGSHQARGYLELFGY